MVTARFALAMLAPDPDRAVIRYRAFVDELPPPQMAAQLEALETGEAILGTPAFVARHSVDPPVSPSLRAIISTGCRHFGLTETELISTRSTARVVSARAWIARTALREGASLATVARALKRDEASLRAAIRNRAASDSEAQPRLQKLPA
jgi:hypothetical protein